MQYDICVGEKTSVSQEDQAGEYQKKGVKDSVTGIVNTGKV